MRANEEIIIIQDTAKLNAIREESILISFMLLINFNDSYFQDKQVPVLLHNELSVATNVHLFRKCFHHFHKF